jgi:hypothetical protein
VNLDQPAAASPDRAALRTDPKDAITPKLVGLHPDHKEIRKRSFLLSSHLRTVYSPARARGIVDQKRKRLLRE